MNKEQILSAKHSARSIYEGMQAAFWSEGTGEGHYANCHFDFATLAKAMGYRIERITDDEKSEETA